MDILVRENVFHFKQFDICQDQCSMKVCTDGVLLGAWTNLENVSSALDIGTGSGVIALMLAQRSDELKHVVGIEIDQTSYEQARENAANCNWADRIAMIHSSIQDYTDDNDQSFDLIISNPPFFTGGTLSESQTKNDVRHTIKLPHGDLLRAVKKLMNPQGHFSVILPIMEGYRFIELAEQYGLYLIRKTRVFSRQDKPMERFLMEFSHENHGKPQVDDLVIHNDVNDGYTPEYKNLTGDFYLNF